MVFVSRIAESR
jgi:hypothetical protein